LNKDEVSKITKLLDDMERLKKMSVLLSHSDIQVFAQFAQAKQQLQSKLQTVKN